MLKHYIRTFAFAATSIAAGLSVVGRADAAVFNYTSTFTLTSTGSVVPTVEAIFNFTKTTDVLPNGLVGYEFLSGSIDTIFTAPVAITESNISSFSDYVSTLNSFLPTKYQGIFSNVLSDAEYDYIGDGDFPPPDFSLSFSGAQVPAIPELQFLFSNGGTASLSSTLTGGVPIQDGNTGGGSTAVPEPVSMVGIGLAAGGMAIARRRQQKKAA